MFLRVKNSLRSEKGIFDLPSIMMGVVVTGILAAVTSAALILVVPWFQDNTAKNDINLIKVAETSSYNDTSMYTSFANLKTKNYLQKAMSTNACVVLSATSGDYTVYVTSQSNTIFSYNPANSAPVVVSSLPAAPTVCN